MHHVLAHGKLNLTLDVLRKREDGYHEMRMVMQTVALADRISLSWDGQAGVRVKSNVSFLPGNEKNLAAAAALQFAGATGRAVDGLFIEIEKAIPVCAGMGGGSSDAAAVLRALNHLTGAGLPPARLFEIGAAVGSDVPFCVLGGTALAEGRGERLTPLPPLPPCHIVVCKPLFSVSTPELFSRLHCANLRLRPDTSGVIRALEAGDLGGVARRMYNVFQAVLPARHGAEVERIRAALIQHGALGACMSGTGPTVFGLFDSLAPAQAAYEDLKSAYRDVFLTGRVNV